MSVMGDRWAAVGNNRLSNSWRVVLHINDAMCAGTSGWGMIAPGPYVAGQEPKEEKAKSPAPSPHGLAWRDCVFLTDLFAYEPHITPCPQKGWEKKPETFLMPSS
jgi:hypothetical protein